MINARCNFTPVEPSMAYNMPTCATKRSAAFDLFVPYTIELLPGLLTTVPLNIKWAPDDDIQAIFKEKSGLASQGIEIKAGVIDADYADEWKVLVRHNGWAPITLKAGKAICQMLIRPVYHPADLEVKEVVRQGGFGSTNS
jgi:dUTPase